MMKLAWLAWKYEDSDTPEFLTSDPGRDRWSYFKVVPIVYAEVQE